jgi:hypothetical protein
MSDFDFNNAEPKRAMGALIPDNTVALVVAKLRPGGHGLGNWLKTNKDGNCLMADFEFVVDGGEHDRRKFWNMFVTEGETSGQQTAASITRSMLRAMLESAHGIMPGDSSDTAMEKRKATGWQTFDGLRFCARIGIEGGALKDKMAGSDSERWPDKNVLKAAITADQADYISPGPQSASSPQASGANNNAQKPAGPVSKPAWAS